MADNIQNKILALLLGGEPSPPEVDKLKRALAAELAKPEPAPAPPKFDEQNESKKLPELYQSYATKHKFSPGQLIVWKNSMQNRVWPQKGQPAVVVEVLDKPLFDEREAAHSTGFHEPLDIRVGVYHAESDAFLLYYLNSSRFKPYP